MVMASLASWVHTTTLTILFGTTITRLGALPASARTISGSANAAVSATSLGVSLANCKVPRSLPLSCTAMVTVSSTKSASSASGQGELASSDLWPSACHSSSARCGVIGPARRTKISSASRNAQRAPSSPGSVESMVLASS